MSSVLERGRPRGEDVSQRAFAMLSKFHQKMGLSSSKGARFLKGELTAPIHIDDGKALLLSDSKVHVCL